MKKPFVSFLFTALLLAGCKDFFHPEGPTEQEQERGNGGVTVSPPASATELPRGDLLYSSLNPGATDYYYFYANSGSTYAILWNDHEADPGFGNIVVDTAWYDDISGTRYSHGDGTSMNGYRGYHFTASRSGYMLIEVRGYYPDSSGSYGIGLYPQ